MREELLDSPILKRANVFLPFQDRNLLNRIHFRFNKQPEPEIGKTTSLCVRRRVHKRLQLDDDIFFRFFSCCCCVQDDDNFSHNNVQKIYEHLTISDEIVTRTGSTTNWMIALRIKAATREFQDAWNVLLDYFL